MAAKTTVDINLPIEFSEVCEVVWQDDTANTNGRSLTGAFAQAIVQGGTFNNGIGTLIGISQCRSIHSKIHQGMCLWWVWIIVEIGTVVFLIITVIKLSMQ